MSSSKSPRNFLNKTIALALVMGTGVVGAITGRGVASKTHKEPAAIDANAINDSAAAETHNVTDGRAFSQEQEDAIYQRHVYLETTAAEGQIERKKKTRNAAIEKMEVDGSLLGAGVGGLVAFFRNRKNKNTSLRR